MNSEPKVTILACPEESLSALSNLTRWADEIHMAYAWAHSNTGKAPHWTVIPTEKIKRAVIGIHFAQTEPQVLQVLAQKGTTLKVISDTTGVFHPKVIIGLKGQSMMTLIGSSNLTKGGFYGNTEINVLIEGNKDGVSLRKVWSFMDDQWNSPRAFEPDTDWLRAYAETYKNRPNPPRGPRPPGVPAEAVVQTANNLDISWEEYFTLITEQERRMLADGNVIHIFDHEDGSYIQEIESCQRAFKRYNSFSEMPEDTRKLVSGWGGGTTGLFGSMKGAGTFKNLVREHPKRIARYLDTIPLNGRISPTLVDLYLNNMLKMDGINLGTATRLLGVKRPDLFLPINDGNKKRIREIFTHAPSTVSGYIKFHDLIWGFAWFKTQAPTNEYEKRIWRGRVAMLDAALYEVPDKLLR